MEMKRRLKASGLSMTKIARVCGVKRGVVSGCLSAAERGDQWAAAVMLAAAAATSDRLGGGGIQTDLEDFTG
jgi:hypothetical protein